MQFCNTMQCHCTCHAPCASFASAANSSAVFALLSEAANNALRFCKCCCRCCVFWILQTMLAVCLLVAFWQAMRAENRACIITCCLLPFVWSFQSSRIVQLQIWTNLWFAIEGILSCLLVLSVSLEQRRPLALLSAVCCLMHSAVFVFFLLR